MHPKIYKNTRWSRLNTSIFIYSVAYFSSRPIRWKPEQLMLCQWSQNMYLTQDVQATCTDPLVHWYSRPSAGFDF